MSELLDQVTLSYTGIDLFEQAAGAVQSHARELNASAASVYLQMVDDAIREYSQKGVKRHDPMPKPPKAFAVEISGRTIAMIASDEAVCPYRDYPEQPKRMEGVANVGANMGDPDHPERHFTGTGDTIPLGRVVEQQGKRYRKCGRAGFGGLLVTWYEAL